MRRNDNEIKYNNILFWSKSDDWGQKAATADKKVLFTEETATQSKDMALEPVNFHIEGYIYGADTKAKVAQLYKAFATQQSGILEHKDIGRLRVKFAPGGFRFKRTESKLDYYELVLDFKIAKDAALNIQVVDVEELKEEQLKTAVEISEKSFLEAFNDKFNVDDLPSVKMQTFENLTAISGKLSKITANNLIGNTLAPITGSWDIINAAIGGIGAFVQSYLDLSGNKKNKYRAYLNLADFKPELPSSATSAHEQIAKNTAATTNLIKQTALTKAAALVDEDLFDNRDELKEAAADFLDLSLNIAFAEDNKTVQDNILKTAHLAVVILNSLQAGPRRSIVNNVRLPAAVICYEQGCNEDKFIKNNHIRHPLFVDAGTTLEITNAGN